MINIILDIYEDESFYSYLSRLFAHSGFVNHTSFTKEIFKRPNEYLDYDFINSLNYQFRRKLEEKFGFERLLYNHTLFKYYVRFLSKEKIESARFKALDNTSGLNKFLPISKERTNQYLMYCPVCVKEDRKKYGEAYFHLSHNIDNVICCYKHNCLLKNTKVLNTKSSEKTLEPLELVVEDLTVEFLPENDINVIVSKYCYDCAFKNLNVNKYESVGEYLSVNLSDNYISFRGEQRNITVIYNDLNNYYKNLINNCLTKSKISCIFRNLHFNPYDIILLAMFEKIKSNNLCNFEGKKRLTTKESDNVIKRMYLSGDSILSISRKFNIHHAIISNIVNGVYDKPTNKKSSYRCKKWDWNKIDDLKCVEFEEIKKTLSKSPKVFLTKKELCLKLNLKDKKLRNLPKLKAMLREWNKESV